MSRKPTLFSVLVLTSILRLVPMAHSADSDTSIVSASSVYGESNKTGPTDGNRFSVDSTTCWKGQPEALVWYWQIQFPEPRQIGAILQINGDAPTYLRNSPRSYVWQESLDGRIWREIVETSVSNEKRMFRIHRLKESRLVRYLRLCIRKTDGQYPTLREVEFYPEVDSTIDFPEWCVSVNTSSDLLPGEGQKFVNSLKKIEAEANFGAQEIRLSEFQETFLSTEPCPLCAFMSGNLTDWCQKDREDWRGAAEILKGGRIPIWAACGGAQGLAILAEHGVDSPWDCPHCRDSKKPLTPIYDHIHDQEWRPCGDYSKCVHESGPTNVRQIADDPVFEGLPHQFPIIESHCGQVAWVPKDWVLIATHGDGGKTSMQCMRLKNRYIYAAQFHFELDGTPQSSRIILTNFIKAARAWGGYRTVPQPVVAPLPFEDPP